MQASEKMQKLVKELNRYGYYYYTLDKSIIDDKVYDRMYDELVNLEKEENIVLADSPTTRVGGQILKSFQKHKHLNPLYSMNKAQSFDELRDWIEKNKNFIENYNESHEDKLSEMELILELKFDGLTINLTYEDGYLKMATTRGNGLIGEVITSQVKTINSIPLSIDYKGLVEIQGEGLMPLKSLEEYNKKASEKLKNARNAAAGALRNLDSKETKARNLTAYFYNVNYIEGKNFKDDVEMKEFLKSQGFLVSKYNYKVKSFKDVQEKINYIADIRKDLPIQIDGVTIKINDFKTREILSFTQKFPRWSIAYKFEAEIAESKLLEVVWNVGRSSKVTPSAIIEPVEIDGVTIKRATLNNFDDINRKKLRLNSNILIRRSNDVIPEILGVLPSDEKTFAIKRPEVCPACGAHLFQDGVHIFCPNTLSCRPQLVSRLVHFASRDAMNINGFSEKTIEKFMDELGLKEIPDIYNLKYDDIIKLEGFKEKKTKNLLEAIENSKNPFLSNFIYAIGIANVGIKTARDLAKHYKNFMAFSKASFDDLIEVGDIGPITAKEIINFFADDHIKDGLQKLFSYGIKVVYEENLNKDLKFEGKTVVITGSLSRKRKELEEELINNGAKVSSSVSKNTDFLIVGENPGSKYDKARELSVEILNEEELNKILGGGHD